jgi:hypothetical protein
MDNAENQPRTQQDAHEHTWREEQAHYLSRQSMIGHPGIVIETQHLCPASPSRGGLSGLAGVPPGIRPARCPRGGVPPAVERQLHLLTVRVGWGLAMRDSELDV